MDRDSGNYSFIYTRDLYIWIIIIGIIFFNSLWNYTRWNRMQALSKSAAYFLFYVLL